VSWLIAACADLPIVLIGEPHEAPPADIVDRLSLRGYIPTASSADVVAAALHLIFAGGSYFPRPCRDNRCATQASAGHPQLTLVSESVAKLTPRERSVLTLLEQGLPNKIIGHRLGMSQSTVKAHVHSIITKLNVHNRTEAAVTRFTQSGSVISLNAMTSSNPGPQSLPGRSSHEI
jgi:DNA-binding NarL/FixJ family response regulator